MTSSVPEPRPSGSGDPPPLAEPQVSASGTGLYSRMRLPVLFKSLRLQLTAWYLAFFSALFVLFCLLLYGTLARALERRRDAEQQARQHTARCEGRGDAERGLLRLAQ